MRSRDSKARYIKVPLLVNWRQAGLNPGKHQESQSWCVPFTLFKQLKVFQSALTLVLLHMPCTGCTKFSLAKYYVGACQPEACMQKLSLFLFYLKTNL